ncbi:alpha/beta hydrolase fold domain-containing protein [Pontiella sulfatireligans]|uniref:Carboxylesterase NlhH n=1 Tax=Pontiella sulfatireligans TaxID=2750658 RepID=A0A6C2URG3_9BACT|nr:alpha/beta hydrolase fold domain-containing protein [Pontiella sulfatireligans]VGO21874.1 hypothetical protein SCARR_03954 [Pontiella sulfatireligans]
MKFQMIIGLAGLLARSVSAAVIASGNGTVAAAATPTTSFSQKSAQGIALMDSTIAGGLASNQLIGISGSMTMSASAYPNTWNDQVVLGLANPSGTFFPTVPNLGTAGFSLLARISVASASGAPVTIAQAGTITTNATLGAAADADRMVDYAVNITLASNFEDGVDAINGHVHLYELGLDFNNDGIYDYIESGSLKTFENDRIRLGFGAVQFGSRATPEALTNTYTYAVHDASINFLPSGLLEPVVWFDAANGIGLDSGVPIWTNLASPGTFDAVQPAVSKRPALLYEAWPGHLVVHFDGSDDFLSLGNTASNLQFEGEFTVFTVGRTTGGDFSAYGGFLGTFLTGADHKSGWTIRTKPDGTYGFIVGNGNWNQVDGGTALLGDGFVLLNANYYDDGDDTGTMALRSSLLESPETKGTNPFTLERSDRDIVIGMFNAPNTDILNGAMECDIAEIRIYDRALSEAERQAVWEELSAKYEVATEQAILVDDFQPTGYEVPVGTPIQVTFSEAMDVGSISNVIVGVGGLDGLPESNAWARATGQWTASASNTVFTFIPATAFAPGQLVMCEIPTNVVSAGGISYKTISRETFSFILDNGVSYPVAITLVDPMATVYHDNGDPHILPLELHIPATADPCPVMFWVHGGGWSGGDSGTWARSDILVANMAYYFAEKLGVAVANVSWRSQDNSEGTFTKATNDISLAIQYVIDHATEYGVDTSRMGLYGGSAGTPTSALVAQANTNITCYIGLNGLYDFVNRVPPYGFGGGTSFEQDIPSLAANSAALNVRTHPPDTLLLHGSADTTIEHQQSLQFAEKMVEANGNATALIYRDEVHAFFNSGRPMHLPTLFEASRHLSRVFNLSYGLWAESYDLSEGSDGNDDGDQLSNLYEYGLGGDPTNSADIGMLPTFGMSGGGLEYIHVRRTTSGNGLLYSLELTDDLLSGIWTNSGYSAAPAAGYINDDFEAVTNEITTAGKTNEYIRLRIMGE